MLAIAGITTLVGAGAFAGVASAQSTSGSNGDDSLVNKIAQRFNVNKDDVQKVFDENKSQHQAAHQQKMEERLDQAVKDGKITSAQKDAIIAKLQEMKTYMESIKDKPADEKRALMKAKMDELKQWAKDNGLTKYVPMMGGHHGMGMMHGSGNKSADETSSN
jgi:hypothetical protein